MTFWLHLIVHHHRPRWAWCYYGLTIGEAERRGLPGYLFCHGCERPTEEPT